MSKVMKEDARRYFEAAAQNAEARDERRFARVVTKLPKRVGVAPQA